MASTLYVRIAGKVHGPVDAQKLKQLAAAGKISRDDFVSRDAKKWTPAGNVKGLFPSAELLVDELPAPIPTVVRSVPSAPMSSPSLPAQRHPQTVYAQEPAQLPAIQSETTVCAFCGEQIMATAKKCKHCGEILDVALRAATTQAPQTVQAPQPAINITNVNTAVANAGARRRWSRIVAFFLSLLVPGLGQLYKGQLFNGIVWFVVVAIGYVAFIVPGLILHFCCVIGAAMGDPYR